MAHKHSHKKIKNNFNQQSTSDFNEMLTEVDANDEVVGPVTRLECHNETRKPWHRGAHLYLFNESGELFLTRRSQKADTAPGQWTVSAGGHVKFGTDYLTTIIEEVEEELGLAISPTFLDKLTVDYGSEREVIGIFTHITNQKPVLTDDKASELQKFNFHKVVDDFMEGTFDLSGGSRDSFRHVIENNRLMQFYLDNFAID